ncbi:MAG: DUF3857 domain-containing protein [Terriglobia bacterium]
MIESYRTAVAFQADGTSATQVTARYRALSQAGVQQLGLLVFSYNSANERLRIDYVRVLRPDGTVIETPLGSVQDMPANITRQAPMYSDYRQKQTPVKGLSIGDLVEFQTEIQVLHPLIANEFWYEYNFTKTLRVKQEELEVSIPTGKYVQVKSPDLKPVITRQSDRTVYLWKQSNDKIEPASEQIGASPFPAVQITTFRSWQELGLWWGGLERKAAAPSPAVSAKAAELTKGLTTDQEKLNAIYRYVSTQFRYISLSFGIGRYQPHTASEVLNNLYGDCKDKHTLLASLLDAVGIEADSALINSTRKIDPGVPSPAQFDHVVSVVPEGSDKNNPIWLDTTEEVAPVGFLMASLRGKQALLIPRHGNPYLVKTPADPPFANFQTFEADGKLSGDGTFTGKMRQVARNDYGFTLRLLFFMDPQGQWQQMVQQISRLSGFGGDVSNVTAADPTDTGKPFEYSYDYTRKNYGDWANHRIVSAITPIPLPDWTNADPKSTKPLPLGSPQDITLKSRIQLPAGYTPTLPPAVHLSRDFAEYHSTYSFKAGVFYAERQLIIKEREVPAAQRTDYQAFVKSITDDENQFIPLTAVSADVSAPTALLSAQAQQLIQQARQAYAEQDFSDALDDIQRAVKMAPKSSYAWMMLGGLEINGNERRDDGEAALRKAISLAPKEPTSYTVLAMFLARSGRTQEAIQVWRDLLKQDPDNVAAHANLGTLLLNVKQYGDAVTELEAIAKQNSQNKSFEIHLGMAALGAGKTQEGITALESAAKLDPSPYTLIAVAYQLADHKVDLAKAQDYAQGAVAQEESATAQTNLDKVQDSDIQLMNSLCAAWDTAGWIYFREGKFPQAEKYLESAWVLGEGHLVADQLGQVYEKLGRNQEALHMYTLAAASLDMVYGQTDPNLVRLIPQKAKRDTEVNRAREGISRLRQVRLGKVSSFTGSAEFWVLFSPGGKIDGVKFAGGADQFRPLAKSISLAHFQVPLPDDALTKILRRGVLVCEGANLGCDFTLLDITSVHSIN